MSTNGKWDWPSYTQKIHNSSYPAIDPTNPSNSAAGKVIVITGGNQGVGKGIAKSFVRAGAKAVVILSRRKDVLDAAKAELEKAGNSKILAFQADILDKASLETAFASTEEQVGKIDVLVANAAYLPSQAKAVDVDVADWWKAFELNIKGTLFTFQAFHPHRATTSTFISISSGVVHVAPFPAFSGYVVSKHGQASLTQFLQAENEDIRIMNVHPGVIESEMNTKSQMPLAKDDISLPSDFVVWLASPAAEWLGGRYLWSHWDVDELTSKKEEVLKNNDLVLGLMGWPKVAPGETTVA
jgi:NAD(P)-dependent dehydrogenase (short-subunit alcohol dehydrogenase family)